MVKRCWRSVGRACVELEACGLRGRARKRATELSDGFDGAVVMVVGGRKHVRSTAGGVVAGRVLELHCLRRH